MKFQKNKSSSLFQFSEETIASTKTNDTSAESPGFQLLFDTLKVGVALSGGRHALSPQKAYFVEFYGRGMGFWLLAFSEISRTQFLSYSHFQGVKLKLRSRAFCWCIVCYSTSIEFFQILNSNIFRNWLLHPVLFGHLSTLSVKIYWLLDSTIQARRKLFKSFGDKLRGRPKIMSSQSWKIFIK